MQKIRNCTYLSKVFVQKKIDTPCDKIGPCHQKKWHGSEKYRYLKSAHNRGVKDLFTKEIYMVIARIFNPAVNPSENPNLYNNGNNQYYTRHYPSQELEIHCLCHFRFHEYKNDTGPCYGYVGKCCKNICF